MRFGAHPLVLSKSHSNAKGMRYMGQVGFESNGQGTREVERECEGESSQQMETVDQLFVSVFLKSEPVDLAFLQIIGRWRIVK
jgi:hypothetical protein